MLTSHYNARTAKMLLAVATLVISIYTLAIHNNSAEALTGSTNTCSELQINDVAARGDDSAGHVAKNAIDGNLNTRWSNMGKSAWIRIDLGKEVNACDVSIAWYKGDIRSYSFSISVSSDKQTYKSIYDGKSSGSALSAEKYDFQDVKARYVKINVKGNTENNWASITEINVRGYDTDTNQPKYLVALLKSSYSDQDGLVDMYRPNMKTYDLSRSKPDEENLQYTMQLPGTHGVSYFSLAEIKDNAPKLKAKGVDFVEYDLESDYSPASDMADPVASVKAAAGVVHANGLKFMVNPSKSLANDYSIKFAPYADYYNLMIQALQDDGCWTDYRSFVKDTTTDIRDANSKAKISIEVSTNRGTLQNMKDCISAGTEFADGVSIWYSNDSDGIAKLDGFVDWFDTKYR